MHQAWHHAGNRVRHPVVHPSHPAQVIEIVFESPELKNLSRYVRSYLGGLKTLCVEVDKQEWKYLEGGKGETVVFLHGAAGSKTQWRSLMQEYLPDHRVIAIDLPGLNVTQTFRIKKHSGRQYGVWLGKVLDQLRLERVHLVGTSLGSAVAAYYAAQHPQRVTSLTLLAYPSMIMASADDSAKALKQLLDVSDLKTAEDLQRAYDRSYYQAPAVPRIVLRYNLREFQKFQPAFQAVLNELMESRPMLMACLRQIKVPTLILQGIEDRVSPPVGQAYWQRQIPHARYHEIPECGHMIHIEKPDEVARLHKELLRNAQQLARQAREQDEETGRFVIPD